MSEAIQGAGGYYECPLCRMVLDREHTDFCRATGCTWQAPTWADINGAALSDALAALADGIDAIAARRPIDEGARAAVETCHAAELRQRAALLAMSEAARDYMSATDSDDLARNVACYAETSDPERLHHDIWDSIECRVADGWQVSDVHDCGLAMATAWRKVMGT
jgi:hypothetical protein